ncbi:hypothetical protein DEU56DRAFT_797117 [Suillus clintonianus]|uniref:uncharacterized protein n=1 Tax=Suillus clintonianus TaxID=1904413 RepID=UPI001B86A688|nr:uncharacterized protein DEU56DRAFT_797117 [Suillus clintonianus]KAG2141070.1 hypothetical protein DEU56DRAFT_797117 [Suillus clintonianus]
MQPTCSNVVCTSSKAAQDSSSSHHCTRHSNPTPVSMRFSSDDDSCINFNAPQCCHCGWRGSHSPSCPFR